jgi:2-isopropylmalate synthase
MRKIEVLDTTLRDGEQSPGAAMTIDEKVQIAKALQAMGVDIIEAGFAACSEYDCQSIQAVVKAVKHSEICCLARCVERDINLASLALEHARYPRINLFMSTSKLHLTHQFKLTYQETLNKIHASILKATELFPTVQWSAMDATRSERKFLMQSIKTAIDAGASIICIADTVGYLTPREMHSLIKSIFEEVPNIAKTKISVHCHDDLGLATANTLAALEAGVHQIEGTINGIGERAGNTALEEVIMAIKIRNERYPFDTNIHTKKIAELSKLVSNITGIAVTKNKAIVGENVFLHAAGIHQDGMLKHPQTYQILSPEMIGLTNPSFVLSRHSGRSGFKSRLKRLKICLSERDEEQLFELFKINILNHKGFGDDDLIRLFKVFISNNNANSSF